MWKKIKEICIYLIGFILFILLIWGIFWIIGGFLDTFSGTSNQYYWDEPTESGSMPYPYNY